MDVYVEYVYDYQNRLIRKVLDSDGDGDADSSTVFISRDDQIALQFDHAGAGDVVAGDLSHRYLWGPAVDQILADETVDDGGEEDVLWALTDHLNSVRDLVSYNPGTDTTTPEAHITYDAYGKITNTPAVDIIFGFTGRLFDDDTGLQNNINRWYDAEVGRWLSEDPIGFDAEGANLYSYVDNNPTLFIDPIGLTHCPPTDAEIRNGEAVSVGDLDGDGKSDYKFPNELTGTGFTVSCYSGGGGMFYVTAPDKSFCHRCPYPGGQNDWSTVGKGKGQVYNGSITNPSTGEKTTYKYIYGTGKLIITVYNKKGIAIRRQTVESCKKPSDLPMPREVAPFPPVRPARRTQRFY